MLKKQSRSLRHTIAIETFGLGSGSHNEELEAQMLLQLNYLAFGSEARLGVVRDVITREQDHTKSSSCVPW